MLARGHEPDIPVEAFEHVLLERLLKPVLGPVVDTVEIETAASLSSGQ